MHNKYMFTSNYKISCIEQRMPLLCLQDNTWHLPLRIIAKTETICRVKMNQPKNKGLANEKGHLYSLILA